MVKLKKTENGYIYKNFEIIKMTPAEYDGQKGWRVLINGNWDYDYTTLRDAKDYIEHHQAHLIEGE